MSRIHSIAQLAQNQQLTRRGFLGLLGGAATVALIGCGESTPPPITFPTNPPVGPIPTPPADLCPSPGEISKYAVSNDSLKLESYFASGLQSDGPLLHGVENDPNNFFTFDTNSRQLVTRFGIAEGSGKYHNVNFLRLYPSKDRAVLVANDGFYDFSINPSPSQPFIPFPSGRNLGGGAIFIGAQLFVAVANGSIVGQTVNFGQGSILVYNYGPNGVERDPVDEILVSGLNPTGLGYRKQTNELVVVNSGNFKGGQGALLELISLANRQPRVFTLEKHLRGLTAQVFGDIAMTCDGSTAILGSAAYKPQDGPIFFVDLATGGIVLHQLLGTTFHTGIQIVDERIILVSDYDKKEIRELDLQTRDEIEEGFTIPLDNNPGPSTLIGRNLYQAIVGSVVGVFPV